jgi:hypothetical protein
MKKHSHTVTRAIRATTYMLPATTVRSRWSQLCFTQWHAKFSGFHPGDASVCSVHTRCIALVLRVRRVAVYMTAVNCGTCSAMPCCRYQGESPAHTHSQHHIEDLAPVTHDTFQRESLDSHCTAMSLPMACMNVQDRSAHATIWPR